MTRVLPLALTALALGCSDTSGLNEITIAIGNNAISPQAVVVVTRGADTLYDTTFPPGAHSCGLLEGRQAVRIEVIRSDTTAVFPAVTLDRSVIRVQSLPAEITLTKDDQPAC